MIMLRPWFVDDVLFSSSSSSSSTTSSSDVVFFVCCLVSFRCMNSCVSQCVCVVNSLVFLVVLMVCVPDFPFSFS